MAPELSYRKDLYRGTAPYYDRYRPPYPKALLDDLLGRLPVTGNGKLADLACGTGQVALPLAPHFAEVWAVDQEEELVAYGRSKAEGEGVSNITWLAAAAEQVDLEGGFELITIGNAFHRLDRQVVASRARSWLLPGGGLGLLWGAGPFSGELAWQKAATELLEDWGRRLATTDRVPAGWEATMDRHPHAEILRQAGFDYLGRKEFPVMQTWTTDTLVGYLYSTSFLNREVLGTSAAVFEEELKHLVASCEPEGVLRQSTRFAYELARKPA
ncbi:MAG: class I SAM-dependent methyltransferase [Acidimicrobiales bacterium]|nr:class I SAM-dependent methyltransferase [Acidimicrobiales bacterium]MBO0894665.1 class I SAM-dependent methyltransferase [Acidimicrobiales bacterium]